MFEHIQGELTVRFRSEWCNTRTAFQTQVVSRIHLLPIHQDALGAYVKYTGGHRTAHLVANCIPPHTPKLIFSSSVSDSSKSVAQRCVPGALFRSRVSPLRLGLRLDLYLRTIQSHYCWLFQERKFSVPSRVFNLNTNVHPPSLVPLLYPLYNFALAPQLAWHQELSFRTLNHTQLGGLVS